MLAYDSKTFMLYARLCIFFFSPYASTMHLLFPIFFITIFFRLQSDQSTHHCICDHIYFLLRMLCLLHSVEDQIHLPKSQWGVGGFTSPLSFKATYMQSYSSHSPLWAYIHLLRNPSIIKGEVFFFFSPLMHLIILNHLWNNPMHYAEEREFMQLCYVMQRSHGVPLLM